MKPYNPKYVIWWDSPCKGMINVLKHFCETYSKESIVVTGGTGNYRKSMGWCDMQQCFDNHIIVKEDNWEKDTLSLFNKYHNCVHVFNGITRKYFIHLIRRAVAENVHFAIMTEAYSNLESGYRRWLKKLYINCYLPFVIRPIARKSLGVFCLSGKGDLNQFRHLGFAKNKIVPFGYWTEPRAYTYNSIDNKIHILCPGVLKRYKGVDVLIHAIATLKKKGKVDGICIHVTGNGPEKTNLMELAQNLDVVDVIEFHGALNEQDYQELLSYIDILVAPGYVEPWGIRINEAIQRGQIVICSNGLGAFYLIEESGGGLIFRSGDAQDLAGKIDGIISLPPGEIDKLKKKNLTFADNISCYNKAGELFQELNRLYKQSK